MCQNPGFGMLRGTKLTIYGMHIDLAEFAENEGDFSLPTTFEGFIENIYGRATLGTPTALPPTLESAREYMKWYFQFINPYVPVIDKRDMYTLVCHW